MEQAGGKKSTSVEPSLLSMVLMLSGSAMGYLEAAGDRKQEHKKKENLDLARYTIDLLFVLGEKTRGNLTEEEEKMLQKSLTELRLLYVKVAG